MIITNVKTEYLWPFEVNSNTKMNSRLRVKRKGAHKSLYWFNPIRTYI